MAIFGSAQGLNVAVSLLRNKVVAMVLGPWGMGVIALYNSAIRLLQLATGLGLGTSGVRYIAEGGEPSRLRSWSLMAAVAGVVLCLGSSPLMSQWLFGDTNHVRAIVCLAIVVGLTTLTNSELALLKGRGLRREIALQSIAACLLTALTTIPLLLFWRERAIVPSIVAASLAGFVAVVWFSYRLFPLRGTLSRKYLNHGKELLQLGAFFVVASVVASGSDLLVRTLMNRSGVLADVGLFHAAYMTIMSLSTVFFNSMDTDYYPRLSAIKMPKNKATALINSQIEVAILTIAPFVILGNVLMEWIIPLLFTNKFLPALDAMHLIMLALYLRAMKLPLSYIPLSQNKGLHYFLLESLYYVLFVLFVWQGYVKFGITGAGIGVLLTAIVDYFMLSGYAFVMYKYHYPARLWLICGAQIALGLFSWWVGSNVWWIGVICFVLSAVFSLSIFSHRTRE